MTEPVLDAATVRSGYDVTRVTPNLLCNFASPYEGIAHIDGMVQLIEIFIPTIYYSKNYKSFTQFKRDDHPHNTDKCIQLLELLGFISSVMYEHEIDKDNNVKKIRKVLLEVVREGADEDKEIEELIGEEDILDINKINEVKNYINQPSFIDLRNKREVVGLRLRLVILASHKYSFGTIIHSIINRNACRDSNLLMRGDKGKNKNHANMAKQRPPLFTDYMNINSYYTLCQWYLGLNFIDLNGAEFQVPLWNPSHPFNPLRVFSLEKSMEKAKHFKADFISTSILFYRMETGDSKRFYTPRNPLQDKSKSGGNGRGRRNGGGNEEDGLGENSDEENNFQESGYENPELLDENAAGNGEFDEMGGGGSGNKKKNNKSIAIDIAETYNHYPYYNDVYELESRSIHPYEISKYILPHKGRIVRDNEKDVFAYLQEHLGDLSLQDESKKKELMDTYNKTMTCSINDIKQIDIDSFKQTVHSIKLEIRKICNGDVSKYGIMWSSIRSILFEQFMTIFSADGDTGNSIKAIAKWGDEYLSKNENFCLPFPKVTTNLTHFEDLLIVRAAQQEVHEQTSVSHIEGDSQLIKVLHVYFGHALNPNIINIGAGDTGKSHMVKRMIGELIEGSYKQIGYESEHARMVEGKHMSYGIEVMDDVPAIMLGVSTNQSFNPGSNTRESFLKLRLTGGSLDQMSKRIDENGNHIQDTRNNKCNAAVIFNTNPMPPQVSIPDALTTRFVIVDSDIPKRADGITTTNKNQVTVTEEMEISRQKRCIRMRRTQYLLAMIGQLVYCGLMELDLSGARILNEQILNKAKSKGLVNTDKPRNYHFVESCERVLTTWKAIHECFDSHLSEFISYDEVTDSMKYKKWRPEHIFACEKYLVCTKEIVSLAMGFMEKQFETPASSRVKNILFLESNKESRRKPYQSFPSASSSSPSSSSVLSHVGISPVSYLSNHSNPLQNKNMNYSKLDELVRAKNLTSNSVPSLPKQNNNNGIPIHHFLNKPQSLSDKENVNPAALMTEHHYTNFQHPHQNYSMNNLLNAIEQFDAPEDGYRILYFPGDSAIQNQQQRKKHAISYLKEKITPVMTIDAIKTAVNSLEKTMVPVKKGGHILKDNLIPALKFGVNCWKVAEFIYNNPVENVLAGCVEEVLNYEGAPDQDMLYGKPNESALHVYRVLMIRPNEHSKPLIHRDYSYMDQELLDIATVGLSSVKLSVGKQNDQIIKAVINQHSDIFDMEHINDDIKSGLDDSFDYQRGYSKFAYLTINCDIDKLSIVTHAERCSIHAIELTSKGPPVYPAEHAKELLEYMTVAGTPVVEYPVGLKLFSNPSYITEMHEKKTVAQMHVITHEQAIRSLFSGTSISNQERWNKINRDVQQSEIEKNKKRRFFHTLNEKNKRLNSSSSSSSSSSSVASVQYKFGPSMSSASQISQFGKANNFYLKDHDEEERQQRRKMNEILQEEEDKSHENKEEKHEQQQNRQDTELDYNVFDDLFSQGSASETHEKNNTIKNIYTQADVEFDIDALSELIAREQENEEEEEAGVVSHLTKSVLNEADPSSDEVISKPLSQSGEPPEKTVSSDSASCVVTRVHAFAPEGHSLATNKDVLSPPPPPLVSEGTISESMFMDML